LVVADEVVAVLEFRTSAATSAATSTASTPADESVRSLMADVTRQLARVVERAQAHADLAESLNQRSLHDALTGLPNRALFHDRLDHALALAARRGSGVAVLALDIDRFKAVNDGYGHPAGDELLVAVALRLKQALRLDDTVARTGSDGFAMLCEDVSELTEARAFGERVSDAFLRPFALGGVEVAVSASVGAALAADGDHADALLRNAEVAMEQARQRGPGRWELYDEAMRTDENERLALEQDLRVALRDGHLRVHYQPIVDLATGAVSGVEALVRWQHPDQGLLMPLQFIGPAEASGLIVPLGRWVLEEACRQGAAWQREGRGRGYERLRVSVNVSARQFERPHWVDEVADGLLATGFAPEHLVLEITESVLMDDTATTIQRLGELRELGVRIAIDDFGTGYSSLGYLRQFPIDILKVDKSFIDGVADGPHESALARAVIKLAATLNLDAVAEGVSTRKQLASLRRLRCRYAQGYYFARPLPAQALNGLLGGQAVANW
jgi:diguanylate cyclase (GGDEF)-like protein